MGGGGRTGGEGGGQWVHCSSARFLKWASPVWSFALKNNTCNKVDCRRCEK